MANPNQYSYRPTMGRAVTRKWAEARQVNYDEGWGDDDDDDGYGPSDYQQPLSQGSRSFTNPTINTAPRMSFDRGQEQRNFSAGAMPPGHDFPPPHNLPASRFYSQQPYEQPMGRTSIDSARRPDSRGSNVSNSRFPPRTQSIGQPDFADYTRGQAQQEPALPAPPSEPATKPLPFIRPADIYRRMEEEREKERQSQDSSRPSMDSIQRAASHTAAAPTTEPPHSRRGPSALDTVAERKSEYLDNLVQPASSTSQNVPSPAEPTDQMSRIDTNVMQAPSLPSGSSRYTDRPDPISAGTVDSRFPSRNTSQHEPPAHGAPPASLPLISRTSDFGSSFGGNAFFSGTSPSALRQPESVRNAAPAPATTGAGNDLQHRPSHGYLTLVNDAFTSQNQNASPAATEASLLRSNTTSTSQISPIMPESSEEHFDRALAQNAARANDNESRTFDRSAPTDEFQPPRRLGTNRRDSASPARRPLSMEAPPIPEPQSAITSPGEEFSREPLRDAQVLRPSPAVLVHQKPVDRENLQNDRDLRRQESSISALSENQRTASEEWENWSAAKQEAHARFGIQDSNPATPGPGSSQMSSPMLASSETPRAGTNLSEDSSKPLPSITNLAASRPLMQRDESFRPQLPGGWMSSTSIQQAPTPVPEDSSISSRPMLTPAHRNDSQASIPTARAPQDQNWKAQYNSGIQAQAFAAAASAGSALAGIFNGPSLTGRGANTDSDISSINEEGPTGSYQDPDLRTRDFAATPEPHPAQQSETSATRDFAGIHDTTPRAPQSGFEGQSLGLDTRHPLARPHPDSVRTESPSKESERWWSEDEDEPRHAPAPAPLRTNRQSMADPLRQPTSPILNRPDVHDGADVHQLESDIVKSLTPKSSSVAPREIEAQGGRSSPLRSGSRPDDKTISPPFAAAALAVSPGREYNAVQDQNTFKPLSAPASKAQSPTHADSLPLPKQQPSTREQTSEAPPSLLQKVQDTSKGLATSIAGVAAGVAVAGGASYIAHDKHVNDSRTGRTPKHAASSSAGAPELVPEDEHLASRATRFDNNGIAGSRGQLDTKPLTELPLNTTSQRDVSTSTPSVVRDTGLGPATPQKDLPKPIESASDITQRPISRENQDAGISGPVTPQSPANPIDRSSRNFPGDRVPYTQITSLGSSEAKTRAYKDNRDAYTQPVGQLENWLSHMNQSGHDVFNVTPILPNSYSTPNSAQRHTRESSGTPSGSRQMREDGQKLFASASKYGQKAGVLGKGLFAKGKDKLRTVSASQKVTASGRESNASSTQVDKFAPPAQVQTAPQIPTPVMATPLDENTMAAYFSKPAEPTASRDLAPLDTSHHESIPKTAHEPLFSPIFEVSTNPGNGPLGRTISAVSAKSEQSPQSGDTIKARPPLPATAIVPPTPMRKDTVKSSGGVSAMETDDGRTSGDLLASSQPTHARRDSSVSDVSSVSDNERNAGLDRTRTAGISPDLQPQLARDEARPVLPNQQLLQSKAMNASSQRPQHAPSYSTAMAGAPQAQNRQSKEAEALQDRQEESSLPRYSQAAVPQPRIQPGAQIVPIARIRDNEQPPKAEQNRPFSFAGSESILNAGYPTNHSIDHATSSTVHSPNSAERNLLAQTVGQVQSLRDEHGGSPLPSARRNPEEFAGRSPEEFARLRQQQPPVQTQAQQEEAYRIPGPYGQELRSPRQKASSPLLEQFRQTPVEEQQPTLSGESSHGSAMPIVNALAATEHHRQHQGAVPERDTTFAPPQQQYQHSHGQQADTVASIAEQDRAQQHGRPSKFSSLFRPRSKSRSRLQKEDSRARPRSDMSETGRRPSLLKFGSRGSGGRDPPIAQQQHDQVERPGGPSRKLSKDLFKNSTFGTQADSPNSYVTQQVQPERIPAGKKKRFSGFFGKPSGRNEQLPGRIEQPSSRNEQPQRASTLPSNAQQPQFSQTFHGQATMPQGYQEHPEGLQGQSMYNESQQRMQPNPAYHDPGRHFQGMHPPVQEHSRTEQVANAGLGSVEPQHSAYNQTRAYGDLPSTQRAGETIERNQYDSPRRPDLPRLDTGDSPQQQRQQPASAPVGSMYMQSPQTGVHDIRNQQQNQVVPSMQGQNSFVPPTTRANRDISYGSDNFHQPNSPSQTRFAPLPAQPHPHQFQVDRIAQIAAENRAIKPQSNISDRVKQLHTRSRSPKLGRRSSEDLRAEFQNLEPPSTHSPVSGLGAFNSKKVSPIGVTRDEGEQEKPWAITLPEDGQTTHEPIDPASTTSPRSREMRRIMLERTPQQQQPSTITEARPSTVAERFMSHGNPAQPQRSNVRSPSVTTHSSISTVHNTGASIPRAESPSVSLNRDRSRRGKTPISRTGTPDMPQSRPSMDVTSPSLKSRDASLTQQAEPQRDTSMLTRSPVEQKAMPAPLVAPPPPPAMSGGPVLPMNRDAESNKPLPMQATNNRPVDVFELYGSRPEGYESEEEPSMSATAYPGQEWQPVFDRWDD